MAVEYRILGPLEALVDGLPARLGGPRQRLALAILLAHARETLPAARLIDELWGDAPPETAANVLQGIVSDLRKALGREAIVTRGSGYAVVPDDGALDAERFEQLAAAGGDGLASGRVEEAATSLRIALDLWRGPALADLAGEPGAARIATRLEERRLDILERRLDADLACGRHADVVSELGALVAEHPERERLLGQLMLALYRSGRQVEALDAYRDVRRRLVDELGIAPGRTLQELERAILRQDPSLDLEPTPGAAPRGPADAGTVLVVARDGSRVDVLLSIAVPLALRTGRRVVVARLIGDGSDPGAETAGLAAERARLWDRGVDVRVAAYTSDAPGADGVLLAREHEARLALVDAGAALLDGGEPDAALAVLLDEAPCDLAVLVAEAPLPAEAAGPVATPFGGGEHDWPAIELAAWTASALGTRLRLVGTEADPARNRRDASRLLARASLMIQEVVGIVTEPVLVPAGPEGVLDAVRDASLVVLGLSERWRAEGLGPARLAVVRGSGVPVLLVRRGAGGGTIAPAASVTRFTWSLAGT